MGNFVSNDNATTLFGDVGKKKVGWDAAASSVKKNWLDITIEGIKAVNGSGTWSGNSKTVNGVTFTLVDDGRGRVAQITATGKNTGSGTAWLLLVGDSIPIKSDEYKISGCPSGGGNATYKMYFASGSGTSVQDTGTGANVTLTNDTIAQCNIGVGAGYEITGTLVFKPMIRSASITNADYAPWIPDNAELEAMAIYKSGDVINQTPWSSLGAPIYVAGLMQDNKHIRSFIPINKPITAKNATVTLTAGFQVFRGGSYEEVSVNNITITAQIADGIGLYLNIENTNAFTTYGSLEVCMIRTTFRIEFS